MPALTPRGTLVLLGVGADPLALALGPLVGGERRVIGSMTGNPFDNERTLDFSVLTGVRPAIEIMPLQKAAEPVGE